MSESAAPQPSRRRLWLFNLDAELELARPGPYQTPRPIAERMVPLAARARALMSEGDRCLDPEASDATFGVGFEGRAWSPTPSAIRRLRAAGATPEPHPAPDVLRRVNHRSFCVALGGGAPGACFVCDEAELANALGAARGRALMFKKPFGFAGRGQRRIAGAPSADDRRWLGAAIARGGLVVEPWLELCRELALHGVVHRDGTRELGRVCVQETDAHRAWVSTRLANPFEVDPEHAGVLRARAEEVARELAQAGYFGPFGVDAYLYRDARGDVRLNPLGELNARYTMGFAIGFGPAPVIR